MPEMCRETDSQSAGDLPAYGGSKSLTVGLIFYQELEKAAVGERRLMPVKMPSECNPPERSLRGTKTLSKTRHRLAMTLPGSDWLGSTGRPYTESCAPENKLLKLSMENKSSSLSSTTNLLLATDLNLSSESRLSSKLSLTGSSLLTQSKLTNTQSSFTTTSSLLNSSLNSTNPFSKASNVDSSFTALTSCPTKHVVTSLPSSDKATNPKSTLNVNGKMDCHSLSPKLETTSCSSVQADAFWNRCSHLNQMSSFESYPTCTASVPSGIATSLTSTVPSKAETFQLSSKSVVLPSSLQCNVQSSSILGPSSVLASNLLCTIPPNQESSEDVELSEANLPEEDSISLTFLEEDSQSSHSTSSNDEAAIEKYILQPLAESEKRAEENVQPIVKVFSVVQSQKSETLLKQKKMALISSACCSLVNSPDFSDPSDLTRADIQTLCEDMASLDPEFVLKVALYTRQELNIRTTANFLLAMSARLPACRPHLRRYLCPSVQLPSDWMEVPRLYQSLTGKDDKLVPLPSCLRRALTLKFKEFSEYQLAKYNTRVQRGKHASQKKREKKEKKARLSTNLGFGRSLRILQATLTSLQQQLDATASASARKAKKKDHFSLKSLIQRLHISKPAHHVMSLLGRRYPKDLTSYSRSGLEGPWQSHLAGKRMRLKQPETWERELSQKGNTGAVWESLLDRNKVPFMALLRNLRNMIRAGVSNKHHMEVTARLTNKHAVIQSRLFPFRFLSAYKVIQDLESQVKNADMPFPTNGVLLQRFFRREGKNIPMLARKRFSRRELRAFLAVPWIHQQLKREKEAIRKARSLKVDEDVLESYKKSLEEAVQISALYNIPPVSGRTVILLHVSCPMTAPCHGAKELAVSTETNYGGRKQSPSLQEVGSLLSLMVQETAESAELVLIGDSVYALADLSTAPLLQRVQEINNQASQLASIYLEDRKPDVEYLSELLIKRTKVDTLLCFSHDPPTEEFQSVLKQYRLDVNPECLCVTVVPHGLKSENSVEQVKDVTLSGYTEQVLKYLSERGTDRLLDHVEKVDERFKVPEDPDKAQKNKASSGLLPTMPKQRWRSVRVFISSTFRDMHSERDLLIGQVMPQLRLRAARHFLSLEEVDLRWGITEEEAKKDRQLSLCLSEVVRSQIFIGILGERYGYTPKTYSVPHLPEYAWIHAYPAGRSITELEAIQFLQTCDTKKPGHPKAFFYFRNTDLLRSVPSHWLSDFASESEEASKRLKDLKSKVAKHPAAKNYSYHCQWGGEQNGKPHVTALEEFGAKVLEDIWQVIESDFIKESITSEDDDHFAQEGFQEWHGQRSFARSKLVTNVCAQIREKNRTSPANGRLFLVVGAPSQGKTVFMADLVKELRLAASSSVIYHFTEASTNAKEAETMLTNVCKQLSQMLQKRSCVLTSYRALLTEFKVLLLLLSRSLKRNDTLTLLIDGADKLCGHAGELTSDWIPEILPQRVNLVLSVTEGSSLCGSLSKRKDTVLITLGRLEPRERAELVRGKLALYGKKLEESAFNNQLRLLMTKKGTRDPLYLTMACEELRANAVFEKLSDDIEKLPATLPILIQKRLAMLEDEHGVTNVAIALAAICISRTGLRERDLLRILSYLQDICSVYTASWNEMLAAATHAKNLPMATFTLLLTGLKSFLGMWNHNVTSEPRLLLSSGLLRESIEKRYFGKPEHVSTVHLLMAAHFWVVSSPEDPESSPALNAECLSELSYHLLCAKQFHTLGWLLAHIPFLKAHVELGLLPHLCQVYSSFDLVMSEKREIIEQKVLEPPVKEFREFIERSLHILSKNPSLFYQLALNEPDTSAVCIQTQEILADSKKNGSQVITAWNNKPSSANVCSSKSLDFPSVPGCVGLSSKGDLAVVGTSDGSLHILQTDSGEEIRTLYSGCDGISACTFIYEALVCVGSYDGIIEIWNITDGCRLHRIEAHRRQITGCCVSADRRQLVTCSLDFQLKLWDTSRYALLSSTSFSSPLNCVAFHPRGHAVVVGSWDGKMAVVRLEEWQRIVVLCESSSIRTVSFSLEGSVVVSGTLDGWVSLWSWEAQVQLSRFRAHGGSTMTANFLLHGEYLLTGGEDGKVQVTSGGLGRLHGPACVKNATSAVLSLALSPNRELMAVGYHSDSVCVYYMDTGSLMSQCSLANVSVSSLVWLSNSALVTGSSDSLIRVWSISQDQCEVQLALSGHQRSVLALALSSKLLASASEDVSVCLWSVESLVKTDPSVSPTCVLRGHTAAVTCCSFSPDGGLLATGSQDRSVLCWDLSLNPPVLLRALLTCHKDWVTGCSWTESGMLVSCSGDGALCLWNIEQGEQVLTFAGHQSAVSGVACMGERIISSGRDGCLKVWSLTGLEIANIPTHHNQLTHSAAYWEPEDGRDDADLVVYTAGSDSTVLKWSPMQMEQIQTLYGHGGAVTSSATYPQHEISITAAHDGSVRLWGTPCRDEHATGTRHKGAVSAVAWSPDAELMISGGVFGDLIVWKQQKPILTLQCGELKISSITFTTQRSFCTTSNDQTVSRWLLFPSKGGGLRAKKAYSIGTESLVLSALLTSSQEVQLHMLSGKVLLLNPKTGTMQEIHAMGSLLPDPDFKPPQEESNSIITAAKRDLGVGDSSGVLWLYTPRHSNHKTSKKWDCQQIHSASISCLDVVNNLVITASADCSVKIWQLNPFKQMGEFICEGGVTCLSPSPLAPCESSLVLCHIACGDQYGNVYLLTSLQA
ncbi:telomerase protein component 1 [Gastrophryne carolinensis]